MSIKSRQMDQPHGREHGMIEPFEPQQVRFVNGQKDHQLRHQQLRL
jgi:hypothetical protein